MLASNQFLTNKMLQKKTLLAALLQRTKAIDIYQYCNDGDKKYFKCNLGLE